ncbi:hypothetical protein M8C21_017945 [Ambrosia artemisiifolia]|uniref:Uncharacterized protein n=1 Tax=Ambrosia artemisiifolia TaxID=4212 RepID=A0AAD5G1G8_AMBAR|nr:hypothetical protein M8C21_017945 [Ambrosia artemisiifolia]
MGRESISSDSRSPERDYSNMDTEVMLNVYDLTPVNSYSIWFGFGIFHSGLQGSVCSCLLPENLQVTAVKQPPEYHNCGKYTFSSLCSQE